MYKWPYAVQTVLFKGKLIVQYRWTIIDIVHQRVKGIQWLYFLSWKTSHYPSFLSFLFVILAFLKYIVFKGPLSYQLLYQIHLFFLETSKSYIVFCYTGVMTVAKKFVFSPFSSTLIPSPYLWWQPLPVFLFLPFLSLLLISSPLLPSCVLSWSIFLASQQSTHSTSIITLSVNFWLIIN